MCQCVIFVVVVVLSFLLFFKPGTRGLPTDIYRSILVHFLFTYWYLYLFYTQISCGIRKNDRNVFHHNRDTEISVKEEQLSEKTVI